MEPYKEELIHHHSAFPVDIFISDNRESNISANPHWHDCYEILYILEGTAEQLINGKCFKACKNDLIILNEGDIHGTYCALGEDTRILVIKFLPEIIDGSFTRIFESKYILSFLNNKGGTIYHLTDTSTNSKKIYHLMIGLYEEFTLKDTGYEIYIKGYIYQLIASLIRSDIIKAYYPFDKEKDIARLDRIFKYIEKNFNQKIDLQQAAKMMNLSYSYFARVFKRITGRTFKEYVDYVRICEAEKLILSGRMNISQASYEVGFCNVSSFNRVYKRVRGYPPGNITRQQK